MDGLGQPLAPEPMRSRMLALAQTEPVAQDALARDFLEARFDAGNLALMPLVGAAGYPEGLHPTPPDSAARAQRGP